MKHIRVSMSHDFKRQTPGIQPNIENVRPVLRVMPKWMRDMPLWGGDGTVGTYDDGKSIPTMKFCMPVLDALTVGYAITLAEDVVVTRTEDGVNFACTPSLISGHGPMQIPDYPIPEGYDEAIHKWNCDYILSAPRGYSILWVNPLHRHELPFYCLPGIVDTDRFNAMSVNFPFVLKEGWTGTIPKGTPIIQAIPFKRHRWGLREGVIGARKYHRFEWKYKGRPEKPKTLRLYQTGFRTKKIFKGFGKD